jgi:Exostosin family
MARVYLESTNSAAIAGHWWTSLSRLKQSSLASTVPMHHVIVNPEDADIILFSDSLSNTLADVRNHALTKRFGDKVFVYSTNDRDVPLVPGVYTCAEERWYLPFHMRSGFYIKVSDHDWIQPSPIAERPLHLFSFCGSFDTHPLRRRIARLKGAQGFVRDTSKDEGRGSRASADTYREWQAEYFQVMHDSVFVLCPRGVAPSSYRIFEAMKAGRVPVIIADEWVPPSGPNWTEFSLRVPEARLQDVPKILERLVNRAPEMGLRASQAWDRWFSREQAFQTIVTWCLQIMETSKNQGLFQRCRPIFQLARPHFFRHVVLRAAKNELLRRRVTR